MKAGRLKKDGDLESMRTSGSMGISPPTHLDAHRFKLGNDEYLAFSFPLTGPGGDARSSVGLTASEDEIRRLILVGRSNSEIARIRGTSPRTISNQVAGLYRKLGIGSRRELRARKSAVGEGP